jgi:hypothetical protein
MNSSTSKYHPPATIDDLVELARNSMGHLVVTLRDGSKHVNVQPVRGFPLTQPEFGVSIVNGHGKEILWIENVKNCSIDVRKLLESELEMRDFLPEISRVFSISSNHEPCEWDVQTDRGRVKFVLKNDEDVRRIDANRALVIDANGVQYSVRDTKKMDIASRRYVERYI